MGVRMQSARNECDSRTKVGHKISYVVVAIVVAVSVEKEAKSGKVINAAKDWACSSRSREKRQKCQPPKSQMHMRASLMRVSSTV